MERRNSVGFAARILQGLREWRGLLMCGLLLIAVCGGQAMAQSSDPAFVIKIDNNYLSHAGNTLQNATSFSPDCIWYRYSLTDCNYYYIDGNGDYRFLGAPLQGSGTLWLSASMPAASILRNTEQNYYFYKWDNGVARGRQYNVTQGNCTHSWSTQANQCWEVYWVEYSGGSWHLSSTSHYSRKVDEDEGNGGVPDAAQFYAVTITEHDMVVSNETGGAGDLADFAMEYNANPLASQNLSVSVSAYNYNYIPAYTTYQFDGGTHNYWGDADHNGNTPSSQDGSETTSGLTYGWTISGDGAAYLSFSNSESGVHTSSAATPTVYYFTENTSGHKTATLTLTITYAGEAIQTRTATITVKTPCTNPDQAANPAVGYEGVTVSWVGTSDSYNVYWKKTDGGSYGTPVTVNNVTSYTITGLDYNTDYTYKVVAICSGVEVSSPAAIEYPFTTKSAPGVLVYGAVFGGGRMADVNGYTEVVVINCDSISSVFGGNDIAGAVQGADGSTITLGVDANDTYSTEYNAGAASTKVIIGSVYGGGNGYYAYNGTSFVAASSATTTIEANASVKAMTPSHTVGDIVWTNGTSSYDLTIPSIVKTAIVVTNNTVKVDSIFGGAKNAFLTFNDYHYNGDSIAINGGTIYSVFGGNNFGGSQAYGKHHIEVNNTDTNLNANIANTATTGYGRDFGIRYIFGGGNKVYGSTAQVFINGGQVDTVFGGGNNADVYAANVTVQCPVAANSNSDGKTFGSTYSNAITSSDGSTITVKTTGYNWNGTGIYNVRTLFGGNNAAPMSTVPNITLTSGSVGTAYGGGNAGDMLAHSSTTINDSVIEYGTHVEMNSPLMLVDNLYGGCQVSSVDYSTWVEMKDGHVGTIYGGCNISGDVGSTKINPDNNTIRTWAYQDVQGATYVVATGGTVYKNLFGGSNGFYHCNVGGVYGGTIQYGDRSYYGVAVPTHNETNVIINGVTVKGNVYGGGNLASVGFASTPAGKPYPELVGMSILSMSSGTVEGNVFGGGNMASIYGSNNLTVSGGTIGGALYGGNDRSGQVAMTTNRVLPDSYSYASDTKTPVGNCTYVGITGSPNISTVFGGGNGDYDYDNGDEVVYAYCDKTDKPIQASTFVDVGINGGTNGGHIGVVYGGGDGVTVRDDITVFVNVQNQTSTDDIDTIFGGNNKGDLDVVPEIILLKGQVNTVYGGCNQGAMTASSSAPVHTVTVTSGTDSYTNVGSLVRLRDQYTAGGTTVPVTASVSGAVFGGSRSNGVSENSLVLVEGGTHTASIFGGSDISGTVSGTSQVVVKGGTVGVVYGGGNGNYNYASGTYAGLTAPICANTLVDILGGNVGTLATANTANVVFGGGYGQATQVTTNTTVNIGPATGTPTLNVYGNVYGGSALGEVNNTTVNVLNGHVYNSVYGGGLGDTTYALIGGAADIAAVVNGNVVVNIGQDNGDGTYSGNATVDGIVFGGNNNNGAPAGTVNVNVYKTAHNAANTVSTTEEVTVDNILSTWPDDNPPDAGSSDTYYALKGVYGGGNLAHKWSTGLTTVHIYGCDNTVKYVYGGGKAANMAGSDAVIVDGGHIYQVFGGGDGAEVHHMPLGGDTLTYANIGGNASTTINGGYIHYAFGGSNTRGAINGSQNVTIADAGLCFGPVLVNFFAGGNFAETTGDLNTTIEDCDVKFVNFYGGANQARITGDVTINIYGGTYYNIYGGSNAADIIGNVEVNFHGGRTTNIYGGNNASGQISGNIVVNVEKCESTTEPLFTCPCPEFRVDNVYGGGNNAAYGCTDCGTNGTAVSHGNYPQVNIKHTGVYNSSTGLNLVGFDVYGGGYGAGATVYGNPQVTIGDNNANHVVKVGRNVFGGGNAAAVEGSTNILVKANATIDNNVYGGGNAAAVSGNTNVQIGE